jgi:hypothetical protein
MVLKGCTSNLMAVLITSPSYKALAHILQNYLAVIPVTHFVTAVILYAASPRSIPFSVISVMKPH